MFFWRVLWRMLVISARYVAAAFGAFFLWAVALYYAPHVVLGVAAVAEVLQSYVVQLLASTAPPLAALFVSLPVTPNLIFLVFFLPALGVVQACIEMFKNDGRYD